MPSRDCRVSICENAKAHSPTAAVLLVADDYWSKQAASLSQRATIFCCRALVQTMGAVLANLRVIPSRNGLRFHFRFVTRCHLSRWKINRTTGRSIHDLSYVLGTMPGSLPFLSIVGVLLLFPVAACR
jgi:hypothetical protein